MESLLAFVAGMFIGAILVLGYGWYQVNKIKKVKDELMKRMTAKAAEMDRKKDSIKDRLTKASDIAQAQMAVRAQIEMPSKNALDSKYKNGLMYELRHMEQEKLDLLRTVLAEGFDPLITVINESGAKNEIPLSAYVDEAAAQLDANLGNPPPNDPNQPKKTGKFILYKGGKDDGTTH